PDSEDQHRFLLDLGGQIEPIEDPAKLYKVAVQQIARHFGAETGAAILRNPVSGALQTLGWGDPGGGWDDKTISAFLDLERPALPRGVIMAPILIGGRAAGVMVLRRRQGEFEPGSGRRLARLCRKVAHEAALREERRVNRVVDQIKDKTVRELRPKDLFYQILHGLRALTNYDHSSALLICDPRENALEIVAEQIAWLKGKSRRIGLRLPLNDDLWHLMRDSTVYGFNREDGGWREWLGQDSIALAQLLDSNNAVGASDSDFCESAM